MLKSSYKVCAFCPEKIKEPEVPLPGLGPACVRLTRRDRCSFVELVAKDEQNFGNWIAIGLQEGSPHCNLETMSTYLSPAGVWRPTADVYYLEPYKNAKRYAKTRTKLGKSIGERKPKINQTYPNQSKVILTVVLY